MARLTATGQLDTTFGAGGLAVLLAQLPSGIALQSDGKILIASGGFSPPAAVQNPPPGAGSLARYNSNGSLDRTFGISGQAASVALPYAVAVQTDGRILVAGGIVSGLIVTGNASALTPTGVSTPLLPRTAEQLRVSEASRSREHLPRRSSPTGTSLRREKPVQSTPINCGYPLLSLVTTLEGSSTQRSVPEVESRRASAVMAVRSLQAWPSRPTARSWWQGTQIAILQSQDTLPSEGKSVKPGGQNRARHCAEGAAPFHQPTRILTKLANTLAAGSSLCT